MRIAKNSAVGGRRGERTVLPSPHPIWMPGKMEFSFPVSIVFLCLFISRKSNSIHQRPRYRGNAEFAERRAQFCGWFYLGRCRRFSFVISISAHHIFRCRRCPHFPWLFDCFNFSNNLGSSEPPFFYNFELFSPTIACSCHLTAIFTERKRLWPQSKLDESRTFIFHFV